MLEDSEMGLQPYTELVMTNAMVDCKMERYQTKIKCRTDENSKYENTITMYKSKIEQLEKSIQMTREHEEKVKNNIDSLRNSRLISEGLVMSMKHELQISQEKREETKKIRKQIIDKYTEIFASYKEVYSNLPWIQKNRELQIDIENGKIELNILKSEYSSIKKKISLFRKVNEQRTKVAIINLAKIIVHRKNLQNDIDDLTLQTTEFQQKIESLKEGKKLVQNEINLRVKAAVAEARERTVNAQTNSGIAKVTFVTTSGPASKLKKESIFSRLGISGPLTLKRPPLMKAVPVPQKLPRTSDLNVPIPEYLWKQKEKVSDIPKGKSDPSTLSTQISSEGKDVVQLGKENTPSPVKAIPKKILPSVTETTKNTISVPSKVDPVQPLVLPIEATESLKEDIEKHKKKIRKKMKKSLVDTEKHVEANEKKIEKKVTFFDDKVNNKELQVRPTMPKVDEQSDKEQVIASEPADKEEPLKSIKSINSDNVPVSCESSDKNKSDALEETGNLADISMDSDSLLSTNFVNDKRSELNELVSRNLDSPDFLIQRPGGYCFSPPFGKSNSLEKFDKGKQSVPDFLGSMSPLFPGDKKNKTAQSSSFDFFGSSSPKKNENSTKSFFQLFG